MKASKLENPPTEGSSPLLVQPVSNPSSTVSSFTFENLKKKNETTMSTCEGKGLMMNRMILDLIESHCHKILVDNEIEDEIENNTTNNADRNGEASNAKSNTTKKSSTLSLNHISDYFNQLDNFLSLLKDNEECVYSHGRLHSRLSLVLLIYEVLSIRRSREEGNDMTISSSSNGKDESDRFFSSRWQDVDWKRLEEQLILAKSTMLCKDANRCILPEEAKGETKKYKKEQGKKEGEENMAQNKDSFERDFQQLVLSLKVESEIAKFYRNLKDLQNKQCGQEAKIEIASNTSFSSSFRKELTSVVAQYASQLNNIFNDECEGYCETMQTDADDVPEDEDDYGNGSFEEDDDDSTTTSSNSSFSKTTKFLSDLTSFLLPIFYNKKNRTDDDNDDANLILLHHIMDHLETQIMYDPNCEFSYEQVETKFRSLLHQWSNKVLDPPILIQNNQEQQKQEPQPEQQYQQKARFAVASLSSSCSSLSDYLFDEDCDEVSSWGGDDDGEMLLRALQLDEEKEGQLSNSEGATIDTKKSPMPLMTAHSVDDEDNRTIVTAVSASNSCYSDMMDCVSSNNDSILCNASSRKRKLYEEQVWGEEEPIPLLWLYSNDDSYNKNYTMSSLTISAPVKVDDSMRVAKTARVSSNTDTATQPVIARTA